MKNTCEECGGTGTGEWVHAAPNRTLGANAPEYVTREGPCPSCGNSDDVAAALTRYPDHTTTGLVNVLEPPR